MNSVLTWRFALLALLVLAGALTLAPYVAGALGAQSPIPAQAHEFFQQAYQLSQGQPTCPDSVLRQKEFFYRKAVEIAPAYPEAWNNLGDVYENLGEYDQALESYTKASQLAPDRAPPLFGIADLHFRAGRWQEAIEYYDRGLKLDPGDDLSRQRRDFAAARLACQPAPTASTVIPSEEIVKVLAPFGKRGLDGIVNAASLSFGETLIPFHTDSAQIMPQAKPQLDQLAKALRDGQLAASSFEVAGHTDERGAADYNLRLSQRRAEAVKAYLVRQGVEAGRLFPRGYGKRRPVAFGHDPVSWAANRRVEVRRLDREDLAAARPTRPLSVGFGVLHVQGPARWELVKSGQTALRSGDVYQIYVNPREQCYVYLYQVDSSGKGSWLFPSKEIGQTNPLQAGGEYWLPRRDQFFRLDQNRGTEKIRLVASTSPAVDLAYLNQQKSVAPAETEKQFVKMNVEGVRVRSPVPAPLVVSAPTPAPRARATTKKPRPEKSAIPHVTLEGPGEFTWTVEFRHE